MSFDRNSTKAIFCPRGNFKVRDLSLNSFSQLS
jgi:hypothetical protein